MDLIALAAAKKYTEDSLKGAGALKGQDGLTPYIKDGNWWIGDKDTGIKAVGDNYVLTDADKTEIAEEVGMIGGAIRYDKAQDLTPEQKAQARANIGAGTGGSGGLTEIFWKDIKDRPFDATVGYVTISENQSITTMDLSEEIGAPLYGNFVEFETPSNKSDWISELTVVYDGITYNLQYKYNSAIDLTYFGNGSLFNFTGINNEDTGEPFGIGMIPDEDNVFIAYMLFTNDTQETTHTLSISRLSEIIKTLDPKYIADMYYDTRKIYHFDENKTPNPPSYPVEAFGINGYKIFDLVPTLEEFFDYKIIYNDGRTTEITFTNKQVQLQWNDAWMIQSDQNYTFALCHRAGTFEANYQGISIACEVPEPGIYFMYSKLPSDITFELNLGGELKQIDPKFIPADLDNYYTKNEISNIITNNLQGYYTKSQVDNAIENAIENVSVDLSGYYTKDETYSKKEVDNALNNIDLSKYYTKTEIDDIIGDIGTVLDEINALIGE